MPCGDIAEILRLEIDADDRVVRYSVTKRTCGGAVGRRSLIAEWLSGRTAEDVARMTPADFQEVHRTGSRHWEYLYLKHFLAVQSGLAILFGQQAGGAGDLCAVESVAITPDGHTRLIAHLRLPAMTEAIESCRDCCTSNARGHQPEFEL